MKKIICLLISLIATFSLFACGDNGGGTTDGGQNEIEIQFWKSGLGDEYFKQIVEEFKKEYPEYTLNVHYDSSQTAFATQIAQGANINSIDLYFRTTPDVSYNQYLEPLNGILNEANNGETKKVGEKIDAYLLDNAKASDGNYYSLPYGGGICGIVYNEELMNRVLSAASLSMPKTTDELRRVVLAIESVFNGANDPVPFIHWAGGYWNYVTDVWQAQYDGLEEYENFYRLGSPAADIGTQRENPSKDILLRDDGRYEVIKVLAQLLNEDRVAPSSNSDSHTSAQTKFKNGSAVMMCNGAWLVNEMRGSANANFRVMKTPVISSIRNKCETISDDEELSALISAIDNGETSLSGEGYEVNQADFDRVKTARNLIWQVYSDHGVCIPNYATAKEGAKKFVKFYFSDKAQKIFNDSVHIALPLSYDNSANEPNVSAWNDFEKDMYDYSSNLTMLGNALGKRSLLFTTGGLSNYPAINDSEKMIINDSIIKVLTGGYEGVNAKYVWEQVKNLYETRWNTYKSSARL